MPQNSEGLARTARAAGLDLPPERLEVLAASAERVKALLVALAAIDYGTTEPASRFRPPSRTRDQ